jgi:hypothetical protein
MATTNIVTRAQLSDRMWPEWARPLDAAAACGLGKSRLYELLRESKGKISSCLLTSQEAARGPRLINLPSLFAYIAELARLQQREYKK